MKRWRWSRTSRFRVLEQKFSKQPSTRWVLAAADFAMGFPLEEWPPIAILGRYFNGYFFRYRRKWKGTCPEVQRLLDEVELIVEREEDAALIIKGIDVVFTDKFRWWNGRHIDLLVREDWFRDRIIPAINAGPLRRGEQSEWTSSSKGGYRAFDL